MPDDITQWVKDTLAAKGNRFLSLKKEKTAVVKLLARELKEVSFSGKEPVKGVRYEVEHDGENKEFFTSSIFLIQQLQGFKDGETVFIECKSVPSANGFKTAYKVQAAEEVAD